LDIKLSTVLLIKLIINIGERRLLPPIYKLKVGESALFTCQSDEDVTWLHKNNILTQDIKGVKMKRRKGHSLLIVRNIGSNYQGKYTCVGYEWGIRFTETAKVEVLGKK